MDLIIVHTKAFTNTHRSFLGSRSTDIDQGGSQGVCCSSRSLCRFWCQTAYLTMVKDKVKENAPPQTANETNTFLVELEIEFIGSKSSK